MLRSFLARCEGSFASIRGTNHSVMSRRATEVINTPFHFTLVQNIKRDPFEMSVGIDSAP
jgi:hypothetical protein